MTSAPGHYTVIHADALDARTIENAGGPVEGKTWGLVYVTGERKSVHGWYASERNAASALQRRALRYPVR